jgi:hypothetical protein
VNAIQGQPQGAPEPAPEVRVCGEAILYRLHDVGYEIDLDRVFDLLAASAPERPRPVRGEALAIQIPNPPVTVGLGVETAVVAGAAREVELSARIFDFGVVSLRARLAGPADLSWRGFVEFGAAVTAATRWRELFDRSRERLLKQIGPAVEQAGEAPVSEDYVIFRVNGLTDAAGARLTGDALRDEDVARLLVGETRTLAAAGRRDMLSQRFTYLEDELAVLTWNAALVVEPVAEDRDVQYVLEFANAQLLELRHFDAVLDGELPKIYDRIAETRHGLHVFGRQYGRLLGEMQARVMDSTELVERVENSLKVTDDVFLARIYASTASWRSSGTPTPC